MLGEHITLGDKTFRLYITEREISNAVNDVAEKINADHIGKRPLIIPILNGSFMFASDLAKQLTIDCEFSFIKASSYKGDSSTGTLTSLIGLNEEIEGRDIILLEDIIDTGHTLAKILPSMLSLHPASIKIATLLFKPNALKTELKIDYIGMEIPNEFIVGYGLDYNGLGRNLKEIYQVI
jgi:hypoxanthine phosphoribosyltransferase